MDFDLVEDEDDFGESRIEAADETGERAGEHADYLATEDVDAREFGELFNLIGSQNMVIEEPEFNGGELMMTLTGATGSWLAYKAAVVPASSKVSVLMSD